MGRSDNIGSVSSNVRMVVLVSTQHGWHGGEEQARLLVTGLCQQGWRCVIFARSDGEFAQRMQSEGFEVHCFRGNGRGLLSLLRMRKWLKQLRPDVLHYNDSHAMISAGLAGLGLNVALRVVARRVDFPLRSTLAYRWFCDRVVCVSNAVANVCRQCGIPEKMLRVVHDGVDPARAQSGDRNRGRQSLGLTDNQTLLLTVAKLTDHKGHRFLLEAMPAVLGRYPNVVLALAGDGELLEPLRHQADRLGIAQQVRFLGYRRDVPDLLHAADLFVLPSHMEGLCSTLIDAMLANCPIVATTAGGIPDLLDAGQAGQPAVAWLVPPADPYSLAAAIINALDSPAERQAMCNRACHRAELLFTADRMVQSTLVVYGER